MDMAIAVLARMLSSESENPVRRADIRKHVIGLLNNHPDIALMFDTSESRPHLIDGRLVYPVHIRDPDRIARVVEAFAARLTLAVYRNHTGRTVPTSGKLVATWYSNVQLFGGDYPEELVKAMGLPHTLQMGKNSVAEQFRYWFAEPHPGYFGVFAAFRESFAVMGIVRTGDDDGVPDGDHLFRPGFLQDFHV